MLPVPRADLTPNTFEYEITPLVKPTPLFRKLDDSLGETGPEWAPIA